MRCVIRAWEARGHRPNAFQVLMMHRVVKYAISTWVWVLAFIPRPVRNIKAAMQKLCISTHPFSAWIVWWSWDKEYYLHHLIYLISCTRASSDDQDWNRVTKWKEKNITFRLPSQNMVIQSRLCRKHCKSFWIFCICSSKHWSDLRCSDVPAMPAIWCHIADIQSAFTEQFERNVNSST